MKEIKLQLKQQLRLISELNQAVWKLQYINKEIRSILKVEGKLNNEQETISDSSYLPGDNIRAFPIRNVYPGI